MERLKVSEHHSTTNPSEVVRVEIQGDDEKPYVLVVHHLGSQRSIVVDLTYPDERQFRLEHIHYSGEGE